MKTNIILALSSFLFFVINLSVVQSTDRYWIYDDFSGFEISTNYITDDTIYNMLPNDIGLKTYYANFETTEGDCQNKSSVQLRIRGLKNGGGAISSTSPVVITSIIVEKYDSNVEQFTTNCSTNPTVGGSITCTGTYCRCK